MKKFLSLLLILFAALFLILIGFGVYLFNTGVRVVYDETKGSYLINVLNSEYARDLVLAYPILQFSFVDMSFLDSTITKSVFGNVLRDVERSNKGPKKYVFNVDDLDNDFKKSIDPLLSASGESFADWSGPWDWKTSWILVEIVEVRDNSLDLIFIKPDNKNKATAIYECDPSKTIMIKGENRIPMATKIDILDEGKPGYLLYSHCLNSPCTLIGNGCVLVNM